MVEFFINSMLGSLGDAALDFMRDHPGIVTGVMALWLLLFAAGQFQLWHIRRQSAKLVVEKSGQLLAQKPQLSSRGLYKRLYPEWVRLVPGWGWFVPHRLELWPVPVRVETVKQKFDFSPQWIAEVLHEHNINLVENENRSH